LKDVPFEVRQGEVVGIIGRNGAGKTTLLKILSRITEPTEGRAEIHGRVGSLLEVGTGFHPTPLCPPASRGMTGRENIYLNGAILGMKKADFPDFEFGISKFAGMYVRLAFAVVAHPSTGSGRRLEPEILLVDESLS
jgi:lipopolysaccharide transport system ATP-binding protein